MTGSGLSFCMHWLSIIIVAMPICCCCDDGIGWIMPIVSDANVTIFAEFYFHFEPFFSQCKFSQTFSSLFTLLFVRLNCVSGFVMKFSEWISLVCNCIFKECFCFKWNADFLILSFPIFVAFIAKKTTCNLFLGLSLPY